MAKDGTNRGGKRPRTGPKPKSAAEKIQMGKTPKVLSNEIPSLDYADLEPADLPDGVKLVGVDMPKPAAYLSAKQKNGEPFGADKIYKEAWLWLKERNCENLVSPLLLESLAAEFIPSLCRARRQGELQDS